MRTSSSAGENVMSFKPGMLVKLDLRGRANTSTCWSYFSIEHKTSERKVSVDEIGMYISDAEVWKSLVLFGERLEVMDRADLQTLDERWP